MPLLNAQQHQTKTERESFSTCCSLCGETCSSSDSEVTYIEGDIFVVCPDCADRLRPYGYRPTLTFYKEETDVKFLQTYIGFELEVELCDTHKPKTDAEIYDRQAKAVRRVYQLGDGRLYCTQDGSLGCGGFEIVSHPHSLKAHLKNKNRLETIFSELSDLGYDTEGENAGLHFHISRRAFGISDDDIVRGIGRLIELIERNKKQIEEFSRRRGNFEYCEFLDFEPYLDNHTPEDLYDIFRLANDHSRYLYINETSETLEFRFFKCTTDIEKFYESLYLVYNLVQISKGFEDLETLTFERITDFK